jgi:hypothetical protein
MDEPRDEAEEPKRRVRVFGRLKDAGCVSCKAKRDERLRLYQARLRQEAEDDGTTEAG